MKKILITLLSLSLLTGCATTSAPTAVQSEVEDEKIYTLFTINTHDWVYPEDSAETLNHLIDIHETYDVPVDIYLNDQVFQNYVENDPELIERLKTSDVVAISYHIRPPYPYYPNFDTIGLAEMEEVALEKIITEYEEYRIDVETGLPTDEPGGYQFIKDTIGYAPLAIGVNMTGKTGEVLANVYREKGAEFIVVHGRSVDLGETQFGSFIRPEHNEIKLYEWVRSHETGEQVFETALSELEEAESGPQFINLKYHENNFYLQGTPFWPVYWEDDDKAVALDPPYDTSISEDTPKHRSDEKQAEHWALYESTVKYASEHTDKLNPINAFDLAEMI